MMKRLFYLAFLVVLLSMATAKEWYQHWVDENSSIIFASLAFDSSDNAHISYYDGSDYEGSNGDLKYAVWNGTSWQIETVDADYSVGRYSSLALDSSGNPHISYYDASNGDLKYAVWNGTSWQIETLDSNGYVGKYTSLALDSSGNPHISYYDYTNDDLKYAVWNGTSWQIETVDADSSVGRYSSLKVDPSGNPHISYYDNYDDDLKYAVWNGTSWQIETVDADGDVGTYASIALNSFGIPSISYINLITNSSILIFTTWNGLYWEHEIVDSGKYVGKHNSLALDSDNNPHISYHDTGKNNLMYAFLDFYCNHYWSVETVDADGDVGGYTSLAMDSSDFPHISYHDRGNNNLKYAAWNGTNWEIETVDSTGEVGSYTSLALDTSDHPHISYYDYGSDNLKYAAWNGASWEIQTVDSDGDVGSFTSLALDSGDNPHISYNDYTNNDLKYSWHNEAPSAFSLLSPSDGATVDDYPLCDWEDALDYHAVSYDLWYSTEYDFDPREELTGLTDSEHQFSETELDPGTIYFWKVRAWDGYEETWSTETWTFYVPDNVGLDGVELAASPAANGVLLGWTISGDTPSSIRVLRGEENPVAVSGSLPGETSRWLDRGVEPGESYVYWLETTDSAGCVKRFGPTAAVVVPEQAQRLTLDEPYPNPAANSVSVAFTLPEAQHVSLSVYDLVGRRVTTLSEGELPAGRHEVAWDCAGEASGIYLLRLETQGAALSRRVVVGRIVDR
ncbi:MAG: T9SS type A sorting domain-containing protein [Candidatus Coatesbacteria bacterium]|nr:T9SS type A sorting domain-containing protein [Candidatus Coatesbacteria bacterium]